MRTNGSTRTDEPHRSQTGSRYRSTNRRRDNKNRGVEEDTKASRSMCQKRNKSKRKILTNEYQDRVQSDRQSHITPWEENNSLQILNILKRSGKQEGERITVENLHKYHTLFDNLLRVRRGNSLM